MPYFSRRDGAACFGGNNVKLLDTRGANPKLKKTGAAHQFRYAGLSLYPDAELCPGSKAAGCMDTCLADQGRGRFNNIREARQTKSQFFHNDQSAFLDQLHRELSNFEKLCARTGERGAVRLNVFSDVPWEKLGIPQAFPRLLFVDYCKTAARLGNTPDNYRLIFSYSGRPEYRNQNRAAFLTGLPVAVVFRGGFPRAFRGRPVIDGDQDDIRNAFAGGQIVALTPKGSAARDRSGFVVDNPELIGCAS
jgi:hypothetical protein